MTELWELDLASFESKRLRTSRWLRSAVYAPDGRDSDTLADLGLGFFVGKVGLYLALPLTGEERDVRFFVRLQHRF